jgi:hypothetical protein
MRSTPEQVAKFDDAFEALLRSREPGKVGVDINSLKFLIGKNLDAAHDSVLVRCFQVREEPAQIQRAYVIAVLTETLTGDASLKNQVKTLAASLNLTPVLKRVTAMLK